MPWSGPERVVVSVTRSAEGLHVVGRGGPPARGQRGMDRSSRSWSGAPPVASIPAERLPSRDRLLACHAALARASVADPGTLEALLYLMVETIPEGAGKPGELPRLALAGVPEKPRATAAHPRAYRGTRRKPPRARRAPSFDARPFVGHPRQEQDLGRALLGRLPEALAALAEQGADPGWLARVAERPEEALISPAARPPSSRGFTMAWGWLLRDAAPPLAREAAAAFAALSLDDDDDLRRLLTLLWAEQPGARTLEWLRALARRPPEHSARVARVLLAGGFFGRSPADVEGVDLDGEAHERQLLAYLHGLARGAGARYLAAGLRITARHAPAFHFAVLMNDAAAPVQPGVDDDPEDLVEALLAHIGPEHHPRWFAPMIWERVGQLPGLGDLLRAARWRELSPAAAMLFVDVFTGAVHHDAVGDALQRKWPVMRAHGCALAELALAAPEGHDEKVLHLFRDAVWAWDDPEALRDRLPWILRLAQRMARPPLDPRARPFGAFAGFFESGLADADRERLLELPDAVLKAVESASRRENDRRLVDLGLGALARALGSFALACLSRHPAALCRAGALLGCLPGPARDRVVAAFAAEPLLSFDVYRAPLAETCAALREIVPGPTNPFGRKLSAHLAGAVTLTGEQLRRQLRRVDEKLDLCRLELLERRVIAELAGDLPLGDDPEAYRHALQILPWSDGNRRALRRFLRAHAGGDHRYLERHPRTRAWLRAHPWVDEAAWLRGVETRGRDPAPRRGSRRHRARPHRGAQAGDLRGELPRHRRALCVLGGGRRARRQQAGRLRARRRRPRGRPPARGPRRGAPPRLLPRVPDRRGRGAGGPLHGARPAARRRARRAAARRRRGRGLHAGLRARPRVVGRPRPPDAGRSVSRGSRIPAVRPL